MARVLRHYHYRRNRTPPRRMFLPRYPVPYYPSLPIRMVGDIHKRRYRKLR